MHMKVEWHRPVLYSTKYSTQWMPNEVDAVAADAAASEAAWAR